MMGINDSGRTGHGSIRTAPPVKSETPERKDATMSGTHGANGSNGANGQGGNGDGAFDMRHMSRNILDGVERAGARSMLKGIGLTDEDLGKPMILIANTWIETMPCNFGLRTLAHAVKEGVKAAGGVPMEMNTVAISDGVTMGTEGMKTSLISREIIADSVELVGRGH